MLKNLKPLVIGAIFLLAGVPTSAHEDVAPVWSLDGEYIYFYSYRMDAAQLYRMKADGSDQTKITSNQFHNWWMQPMSGDEILIVSDKAEDERFGGSNLFVYSLSADTHRQITYVEPNSEQWAVAPSFSADHSQVAYKFLPNGFNKGGGSIRLLNLETGLETKLLTKTDLVPRSFLLTPKGDALFFSHKNSLYHSNLEGTNLEKVIEMPNGKEAVYFNISLSPNGHTLAFSYSKDGFKNTETYSVNVDGTNLYQLTDSSGPSLSVNWSPNGKQFVFASYRDGEMGEIYTMNSDGSNQRNITNTGQPPVNEALE